MKMVNTLLNLASFLLVPRFLVQGLLLGSLDTSRNVDEAENQKGFYRLGDIDVDGSITEFCVNGYINTNDYNISGQEDNVTVVGRVIFFIIREVADNGRVNSVLGRYGMNVGIDNSTNCTVENIAVQESDYILVYIRSGCAPGMNSARIVCPLQVNFRSENDSTIYYNGSDSLFAAEETPTLLNRRLFTNTVIQQTTVNSILNVRVAIEEEGDTIITNTTSTTTTTNSTKSINSTVVTISVVIILVITAVIIVTIIICVKREKSATLNFQNTINDHFNTTMDDGYEGYVSASLTNISQQNSAVEDYDYDNPYWTPADKKAELLSQFRKLMIQRILPENINVRCILGSGAFGTVYRGVWSHPSNHYMEEEEVAVKTMENGASEEDKVKFLQEAAIMGQFNHPNIVKILGTIVDENECKIIMELMSNGSLDVHLPSLKSDVSDVDPSELAPQLLYYSRQVASGMSYLGLRGYVHRDLAARNVLVSEDDVCKIGDFGLSRDLNKEDLYTSHGGKIPVKWTAPEALHYRKYSTASDVWSYGCVLYEIWSLGVKPYSHLTNGEVVAKLSTGYRLPPPPGCPPAIYNIMISCWNDDTDARPDFYEICSTLNLPDIKTLKWSPADVEKYSEDARTIGAPLAEGEELFTELQKSNSHAYLSLADL